MALRRAGTDLQKFAVLYFLTETLYVLSVRRAGAIDARPYESVAFSAPASLFF